MTPIKAAAEPSREELKPCPFCGATDVEIWHTESNWPAVQCNECGALGPCTDLHSDKAIEMWGKRPAAPAGTTPKPFYGAECPAYPACDGGCGLGCTKEIERTRLSAPAGNDGVREALEPFIRASAGIPSTVSDSAPFARISNDARVPGTINIITVGEFRRLINAALSLPQPREAFADEIKRADAAPPEASFDNASDMLGYLNAPREAEPVTPITNPLVLPAGIKAGDYASPFPIPDAPGGLDPATIEACAKLIESGAGMADLIDQEELDQQAEYIRALKPQDGGDVVANEDISTNPVPRLHAFKPRNGGESGS